MRTITKKSIAIIGGGPAALLLAAFLNHEHFELSIYEKNKSVGRKFLVAGKGGFNLSHSEPMDTFIERYTPPLFLKNALLEFDNQQLRTWFEAIGISTYVGSSGRIFPIKGIKPIEVLKAILAVLENKKVSIHYEHQWTGWDKKDNLIFNSNTIVSSDYTIFALGGGSWKVTGSDGQWLDIFKDKNINVHPFQAANCAYKIKWPIDFINKNEGKPLKNIAISCDQKTQKGEAVITQFGLEGNAIYALSPEIQQGLNTKKEATIFIDLKPSLSLEKTLEKINHSKLKKTSDILRKDLKLSPSQINLLKAYTTKEEFLSPLTISSKIKKLPLTILSAAAIDEAISTTGGIDLNEVNKQFELHQLSQQYCIGEMLDWNAPTGGYLLQACFSMGVYLAKHLNSENNLT